MIENTNTKQFYPGPILNNTLEITDFLFNDAEQIKVTYSKFNEEQILVDVDLNYGTDYEVTKVLPSDINVAEAALTASTGQVIIKNINVLDGEKLTVYRLSELIQDKDYPRTGAFPAATHEGALDYLTMQNQEQQEELSRTLKVPISTSEFNAVVPVPLPNRILRIDENATGFEFVPYDLDERLDTFEDTIEKTLETNKSETEEILANNKTELEGIIEDNKQEVLSIQSDYQKEMDDKFQIVSDAAEKINELESAVDTAVAAADTATAQANLAIDSVQNIEATSDQLKEELAQEAEKQIENIQSTGFYMRNDNLYFINSKGEEEEFRAGSGLPMFAHIWSDHIYNDASYLRADTFSWHDGTTYVTAYDILEEQYNHEKSVTEIENGITYKRTPDGFKIADISQQDTIRSLYETNGIAWFYIIDTELKRFKLPRTKWGFTGVRDGVGKPVEAGLPDIAFFGANKAQGFGYVSGQSHTSEGTISASSQNPIYGNSNTVQPPATQMYLYFYVGAYKRPETEVNLGQMSEVLNDKVDIDFGNISSNSVGFARYSTEVTNCIAKKPQKFNLELANGVLTLKANSIVTVANSFEADGTTPKFDEKVVNVNVSSSSATANTKVLISYSTSSNVLIALPLANSTAGAGVTAKSGLAFNTTTNKISSYNSSGSLQYADCCLPLAIVSTDSSGKYTTIDQIFYGIGYIGTAGTTGSTIWVDKDITMIIPEDKNGDGTYKNIVFTTTRTVLRIGVKGETRRSVSFYSTNAIGIGTGFMSAKTYADRDSTFGYQYVEDLNKTFVSTRDYAEPLCIIADITCNANAITSFRPKNTFRALDINDKAEIASWSSVGSEKITIATKITQITSGYRALEAWQAPADGWVMCTIHTSSDARVQFMVHTEEVISHYNQILCNHFINKANLGTRNSIKISKGQYFTLQTNVAITQAEAEFVYAKGAI